VVKAHNVSPVDWRFFKKYLRLILDYLTCPVLSRRYDRPLVWQARFCGGGPDRPIVVAFLSDRRGIDDVVALDHGQHVAPIPTRRLRLRIYDLRLTTAPADRATPTINVLEPSTDQLIGIGHQFDATPKRCTHLPKTLSQLACNAWHGAVNPTQCPLLPGAPRGGSGIIGVTAELFLAGVIDAQGVIMAGGADRTDRIVADARTFSYQLADGVRVTQADVRAIQLAKAALRAGIELLSSRVSHCASSPSALGCQTSTYDHG
jgi:hypothetical protein